MTTYAINYAIWTGAVGAVLQYYKKQGRGWQSLLTKGFAQKAVTGLLSSYLQMQNVPLLGTGLDANYMYNGIIGALSSALMKEGKTPVTAAEEQILCALIGHRLAANFGQTFDVVVNSLPTGFTNYFASSGGYTGATIPNTGTGIPNMNAGNNQGATGMAM